MACLYVYDPKNTLKLFKGETIQDLQSEVDKNIDLIKASDTVEQLVSEVLVNTKLSDSEPNLIFYKADSATSTKDLLDRIGFEYEKAKTNGKLGEGVTSIYQKLFIKPYRNSVDPLSEFISQFSMDLGTLLHKCINDYNTSKWSKTFNELVAYIHAKKKALNEVEGVKDGHIEDVNKRTRLSFLLNYTDDNISELENQLTLLCERVHEEFQNKLVFFEVPIWYENKAGQNINGIIDALVVDNEGNVTIYDFKTSALPTMSLVTLLVHFALLYMYKKMLAKYGIPESKITINNMHISYNTDGIKFNSFGIFDPNNTRLFDLKVQATSALRLYFPITFNPVSSEEVNNRIQKIKLLKTTIFTEESLNRDEASNFDKYLHKIAGTEKIFFSEYLRAQISVEIDGETISIKEIDSKTTLRYSLSLFIKDELDARLTNRLESVRVFKEALMHGKEELSNLITSKFGRNINLFNTLGHYTSHNYEVIEDSPIFDALGIIVIYDTVNQSYNFINVVPNVDFDHTYTMTLDTTRTLNLLGNVVPSRELAKYKDANMPASIGNILQMLTLLAIGLAGDTLKSVDGNVKIGNILVVSSITGYEAFITDQKPFIRQLAILQAVANSLATTIAHSEDFTEAYRFLKQTAKYVPLSDLIGLKLSDILELATMEENSSLSEVWINDFVAGNTKATIGERITALERLQQQFRTEYSGELDVRDSYNRTYVTDILKIDLLLSVLINTYRGLTTDLAFVTSRMSIDLDNTLRVGKQLLKNGDVGKFSTSGMLITGLLLGLSTATPYAIPDDTVRQLATLHNYGTTRILLEAEKFIDAQNKATAKWLAAKKSALSIVLISNHRPLYELLFQVDSTTGKIDKMFRFKNPFTDNSLDEADKEFLKESIWNLTRVKSTAFSEDIRKLTYAELLQHTEEHNLFKRMLSQDKYALDVPLRTASSGRLLTNSIAALAKGDWKAASELFKRKLEKAKRWWDPSGISDKQLNEKEEKMKTLQAYNMYSESIADRNMRLRNESSVNEYEWNVNFLVNDFIYSYVAMNVNLQILNTTDKMIATLEYIHMLTGRDLSGQIDEIKKRTTISMYNCNTADAEYKDLLNVLAYARQALNIGVIAGRGVLFAKEMTLGKIKNYLHAGLDYFNALGISAASIAKADAIVTGEGSSTFAKKIIGSMNPADRGKVEALNWLFRVANMDANIVSQKTLADRVGILNTGTDIAYYTNTRPDWYNRMNIFVAKMIEDGTWDAYTLDDSNRLIYDISKDKRYNIFWRYRKNPPKEGDANYDIFQKQKARYKWALQSCIKADLTNPDGSPLLYGDPLPIAYTVEEVNSIKEITGMLYGYFNHEEKTSFLTGTYSLLMMSFKTYIAGELKYYFALPNSKTSVGKVQQVTELDENGVERPVYIKHDDTLDIDVLTTDGNDPNAEPYYDWVADPIEGIATSTLICLGDVFTEKGREDLRTNKYRRRRAEIFLIRMLLFGLFNSLWVYLVANQTKSSKEDKQFVSAIYTTLNVLNKVGNDLSFYHSIIEPIDDLGLVGVDYLKNLATDVVNNISDGVDGVASAVFNNVSAVHDFWR